MSLFYHASCNIYAAFDVSFGIFSCCMFTTLFYSVFSCVSKTNLNAYTFKYFFSLQLVKEVSEMDHMRKRILEKAFNLLDKNVSNQ